MSRARKATNTVEEIIRTEETQCGFCGSADRTAVLHSTKHAEHVRMCLIHAEVHRFAALLMQQEAERAAGRPVSVLKQDMENSGFWEIFYRR
jgi:hypothetical protein